MTAVGIAVFNKALRGAEVAIMGNRKMGICRKVMKRTGGVRDSNLGGRREDTRALYKEFTEGSAEIGVGITQHHSGILSEEGLGQSFGNTYLNPDGALTS